jgi:branched-chain amino acid transport system substrate-binding protein
MLFRVLIVLAVLFAAVLAVAPAARAQIANGKVRIGVLSDLSGGYEQNSGNGSVDAARIAADEFGDKINGVPIEILAGDHQNKPDIGASLAARWFDVDRVDAVTDLVNSAVGFVVVDLAKAKNKTVLLTSAGSADFTGKACAPDNSVHWVYDTYEIGTAIGQAVPMLGKSWFFITADYAFGHALQTGVSNAVTKAGGTVVGSVLAPLGTTDFSSYVLQAQASKADVVAIANGGDDAVNAMKAAREFGLVEGGQKVVPLGLDSLPAIKSTSLEVAKGGMYVTPWWPQINDEARVFFNKFLERRKTAPSSFQVGTYSAVRSYLKAVEAANSTDPKVVIANMRETPVKDAFTNHGVLRPDGRMVHDVYVVQIKTPAESKGEWDLIKLVSTIPGDKAFRPIGEGGCSALTK